MYKMLLRILLHLMGVFAVCSVASERSLVGPSILFEATQDEKYLELFGLSVEQPVVFSCDLLENNMNAFRQRPKCGCDKNKFYCLKKCQESMVISEIKQNLQCSSFGGIKSVTIRNSDNDKQDNTVAILRFNQSQQITATFDRQLKLHGLLRVDYLDHNVFRTYRHGLETGPTVKFVGRGVVLKGAKRPCAIVMQNEKISRVQKQHEYCQPILLKLRDKDNWTVSRIANYTPEPRSLEEFLRLADFEPSMEHLEYLDIEVPEHLEKDVRTLEDLETVLVGLISVHCQNKRYLPPTRFILDEDLVREDSETIKPSRSFWPKDEFDDDEDSKCAKLAALTIPGLPVLTTTNFVCFPGSGSKWIMDMTQFLTGYFDGIRSSFLIKSHHDSNILVRNALETKQAREPPSLETRFNNLARMNGRAVLLIRNPYDAIASWWNHVHTGVHGTDGLSPFEMKQSLRSDEFCAFAAKETKAWKNLILDYLTMCKDVLVIFYESVKEDPIGEMTRVVKFMRAPLNPERFECLKRHPVVKHKRTQEHTKLPSELICDSSKVVIEEAIDEVKASLKDVMLTNCPKQWAQMRAN